MHIDIQCYIDSGLCILYASHIHIYSLKLSMGLIEAQLKSLRMVYLLCRFAGDLKDGKYAVMACSFPFIISGKKSKDCACLRITIPVLYLPSQLNPDYAHHTGLTWRKCENCKCVEEIKHFWMC